VNCFFVFLKGDKVMGKDVKIPPEQLAKAMDADYQKLVQLISGAVNGAPDGAAMDQSGQWKTYWDLQDAVAA
jgi:hypothetical protein